MGVIKCSECGREVNEKELKCNNCNSKKGSFLSFLLKCVVVFVFGLILLIIGTNSLKTIFEEQFLYEKQSDAIIADFSRRGSMVAYGDNGVSITPVDAYISGGIIYVKGEIKNKSGINIKFQDYGIVTANYKSTTFSTDYDDTKTIKNGSESEVVFSLGAYDVMENNNDYPNEINFKIGGYNTRNNDYQDYNFKFYISWRYDN